MPRRKNIGENWKFSQSIEHNLHNVQLVDNRKPAPKYLLEHEIQAVLEASPGKYVRDHAIFRLAYHHGLRGFRDRAHPDARLPPQCAEGLRPPGDRAPQGFFRWRHALLVEAAAEAIRAWVKKRGVAPGPMFLSSAITAASAGRCCTT